jgi:hypothetical protein
MINSKKYKGKSISLSMITCIVVKGEWNEDTNMEAIRNMKKWNVEELKLCKLCTSLVRNFRVELLKDISHISFLKLTKLSISDNGIESVEGIPNIYMPTI